jgi:hypothetical protein
LGASFGLSGAPYRPHVQVGKLESTEFFVTGSAQNHEFLAQFPVWPTIIRRPLRIRGLDENGTAAVYVLEGNPRQKRFRFVGIFEGAALFQQELNQGGRLWVGNVFYADNPKLKLNMVLDGLTEGEKPFLEVHNPTDQPVTSVIKSPPHTPLFAGFSLQLTLPAGTSTRVPLSPK